MHPYEMSTTLRHRSKEESIKLNYGSLYAVVESLRKKGLIEAGETRRGGNRPERTIYALTPEGEHAMREGVPGELGTPPPPFTHLPAGPPPIGGLPPPRVRGNARPRAPGAPP